MFSRKLLNKKYIELLLFVVGIFIIPFFSYAQNFVDNFDGYGSATNLSTSTIWGVCSPTTSLSDIGLYNSPKYSGTKSIQSINYADRYIYPIYTYPTAWTFSQRVYNKGSSLRSLNYNFYSSNSCSGTVIYQLTITSSSTGIFTISLTKISPSVTLSLNNLNIGMNTWSDEIKVIETSSNIKLCYGSNCTSTTPNASSSVGMIKFQLTGVDSGNSSYNGMYIDNVIITDNSAINGVCGSDNGQILTSTPTNLCTSGNATSILPLSTGWSWNCEGTGGGSNSVCFAEWGQAPISAVCGSDNGQTLTSTPTNLCSQGIVGIGTFNATSTGWSWQCTGWNSQDVVNCSAIKDITISNFPTIPPDEDCSSYSIPDKWFCEMKNLLSSAFLPSRGKIQDLNVAIKSINNKAPFNYLQAIDQNFTNTTNNITESSTMNFCIRGACGNISLSAWGENILIFKRFLMLLFSLSFTFWAINYIKRLYI